MRDAWDLALELLLTPHKSLARFRSEDAALPQALRLYALFLGASILFYTFKPQNFPPASPDLPIAQIDQGPGIMFWTKVQIWNPVLAAIWILFLGVFTTVVKSRTGIPIGLLTATAIGLMPLIPLLLYINHLISRAPFALAWAGMLTGAFLCLKKRDSSSWKPLISLILSIEVVNLALLPLFIAAILWRSERAYYATELGMIFWVLGLGSYLLSRIEGISTPKAFASIFLSTLCQLWFVFSMHVLGVLPKDILKALMNV